MKFSFKIIMFITTATLLGACLKISSGTNVVNGVETSDYPSVVRLDFDTSGGIGHCSAGVVFDNTVITAAHCFSNVQSANEISVTINGNTYVAIKAMTHDKYSTKKFDTTGTYDIAVVVFEDSTFFNIDPITLADRTPDPGTEVRLVGYGCKTKLTKKKGTSYIQCADTSSQSLTKRTGVSTLVNQKECTKGMIQINQQQVKVDSEISDPTGEDAGVAMGDSGSPLLLNSDPSKFIGITSWGDSVYENNRYTCYTDPTHPENKSFLEETVYKIGARMSWIYVP